MADKILDVRSVMDEMVSPEGLEAGGGSGEVPVIDITASSTNPDVTIDVTKSGTDEAPDFEFEFDGLPTPYNSENKTIRIDISALSKNMDLTESHPEFHFTGLKDIYFPGGSGRDSITIEMEKDDGTYPSSREDGYFTSMTSFCNYFESLPSREQARYAWVQIRIKHAGSSPYNKIDAAGPFIPADFYGSTYRPQFNISEIVEDQTAKLTINGTQYDAMQLFSIRWYYKDSDPALDINGQLEVADANIIANLHHDVYSTTEKTIGTDYNGDTIYEKTITASTSTYIDSGNRRTFDYDNLLTGVKRIVDFKGTVSASSSSFTIETQAGATLRTVDGAVQMTSFINKVSSTPGNVLAHVQVDSGWTIGGGNVTDTSIVLTIQYTKL